MSITQQTSSNSVEHIDNLLNPLVKTWFYKQFKIYSQSQLAAVPLIHSRVNTLVSAPTGSTKTLTAFLAILNELIGLEQKKKLEKKVYAIYISPLKALNYDIEYNLQKPLAQMQELTQNPLDIQVMARTGDTTPYQRAKMLTNPPHILVTTPESLGILLASDKFRKHLSDVNWIVIDEVHAIAENKRGTLLSLHMEQLQELSPSVCRVGLSATAAPLESIAQFLVGTNRDCNLVKIENTKQLDLKVLCPVKDLLHETWEEITKKQLEMLHEHIQSHKSTLVFTNTRAGTERIVFALKDKYPDSYYEINENPPFERSQLIGAHHGSLSAAHRKEMETKLRDGKMKCIVCSTSLELGIDIGFVDLVILLGSPKGVARLLQRVGRSGHKLDATPKGRIIVTDRDELIESLVLIDLAKRGQIDKITIPTNCLDVLCQFIVGMSLNNCYTPDQLFEICKNSYPFASLTRKQFDKCIDYLSTDYDQLLKMRVYPKISVATGIVTQQSKTVKEIYLTNSGTISDSGDISVKRGQQYLGSIDEGFMELLKPGDIFVLGGETYKFVRASGMTAQVVDAYGRSPTVPRWRSASLSLSSDAAKQISSARTSIGLQLVKSGEQKVIQQIEVAYNCDKFIAMQVVRYVNQQQNYAGNLNEKEILVEYFTDGPISMTLVHTLAGRRVNEALAQLFLFGARRIHKKDFQQIVTDTGFALVGDKPVDLPSILRGIEVGNTRQILSIALDQSELVKRRFRACAVRAFLILRRFRGSEKRVGKQQFNSTILFSTVRSIDPDFILLAEAKREVLDDVTDTTNGQKIVDSILKKEKTFVYKTLSAPTPFGINIASAQFADVLAPAQRQAYARNLDNMIDALIAHKPRARLDGELSRADKLQQEHVAKNIVASFDYKDFWKSESNSKSDTLDENIDVNMADSYRKAAPKTLADELKRVAVKIHLDSQIHYELARLIDGETGGYSAQFVAWLRELLNGAIPKVWSDALISQIKKRAREEKLF